MTADPSDTRRRIWQIADAVLYEGYLLYPYRHSALKNRQRWNFGVVYPRDYHEACGGSGAPWMMRAECLVEAPASATLQVTARFLHLLTRSARHPGASGDDPDAWREEWQEGSARETATPPISLGQLASQRAQRVVIAESAARFQKVEVAIGVDVTREWRALSGALTVAAAPLDLPGPPAYKLTAQIENTTPLGGRIPERHDLALLECFISTHLILQASGGVFVSLLDPPERLRAAAQSCAQQGGFPVLVGEEGDRSAMLAAPIILYDYPQIAPESAGALFDGTEIDEILTLRIMALSDDEKAELRASDDRARAILERAEALSAEQMMRLHGVMRAPGPASHSDPPAREGGDT